MVKYIKRFTKILTEHSDSVHHLSGLNILIEHTLNDQRNINVLFTFCI